MVWGNKFFNLHIINKRTALKFTYVNIILNNLGSGGYNIGINVKVRIDNMFKIRDIVYLEYNPTQQQELLSVNLFETWMDSNTLIMLENVKKYYNKLI